MKHNANKMRLVFFYVGFTLIQLSIWNGGAPSFSERCGASAMSCGVAAFIMWMGTVRLE